MTTKRAAFLTLLFMGLNWPIWANATGGGDCDHPRFQEVGCTYPGEQGPPGHDGKDGKDGKDGVDGRDGVDGKDGRDGIDGKDGRDGIDGKDGIVDYERVNTTITETVNGKYSKWRNYSAAIMALQINLPQDSSQRLTFSGSSVDGTTGIGAGYAYKFDRDDNLSLSGGIGHAGGETVGILSLGFEFGADRRRELPGDTAKDRAMEQRIQELERRFEVQAEEQREGWQRNAQQCASNMSKTLDELSKSNESGDRANDAFMKCLAK